MVRHLNYDSFGNILSDSNPSVAFPFLYTGREWDPAAKSSRMRVVHSFGREDQLDRAAVERLAGSLGRLLGQGQPTAGTAPELAYAGSVAFGVSAASKV